LGSQKVDWSIVLHKLYSLLEEELIFERRVGVDNLSKI